MRREMIGFSSVLIWDRAGPQAPWLHFGHATGMHAELYARLLEPLSARFNILAPDALGHGASRRELTAPEDLGWDSLAAYGLALMDHVQKDQPWWLVGHSMGATCALISAVIAPERVAGMVLLDPPFIPFEMARDFVGRGETPPNPMADQALRRRADFASREEARAGYAGRGVFKQFSDADLDAYVGRGFVDVEGGVRLACLPETESMTYRGVRLDVEDMLGRLERPFVLLAGETGSTVPEMEFGVFAAHRCCRKAARLPGTGHFLPMQAPDAIRDDILTYCK
jgi:pimeloyl-ACP methyl ester carboxylesterase